jgi:hypothetical protein
LQENSRPILNGRTLVFWPQRIRSDGAADVASREAHAEMRLARHEGLFQGHLFRCKLRGQPRPGVAAVGRPSPAPVPTAGLGPGPQERPRQGAAEWGATTPPASPAGVPAGLPRIRAFGPSDLQQLTIHRAGSLHWPPTGQEFVSLASMPNRAAAPQEEGMA